MQKPTAGGIVARRVLMFGAAIGLVASGCTSDAAPETTTSTPDVVTTTLAPAQPIASDEFGLFVRQATAGLLLLEPQMVTDIGARDILGSTDSSLDDLSPATQAQRVALARSVLASLETVDTAKLSPDEGITAEILRWQFEDIIALDQFRDHGYAVNYITGYHAWFPEFMSDIHPIENVVDAVGYIDRLNASKVQMEQVADSLRRSSARGVVPTQIGADIASWQINNQLTGASNHPLVTDFVSRLAAAGFDQNAINDLEAQAISAVRDAVIPGYESLRDAVNELEPRSDTAPGVNNLPQGDDYYSAILRHHMSTDIAPDEVHTLGLTQVDRLRREITDALEVAGYDAAGLGFARAMSTAETDAGFTPLATDEDRSSFLDATRALIESESETFTPMFETFPQTPFEVVRPRPGREGGSGAYYNPPPIDGSRPGLYYLSLAASEFPMQTYTTTNFHEGVPGHHFQLAIQRESKNLPLVQRALTFSGFAEGWGLYAERLAYEAGVYDDDPAGNIGRLRMELLRAARVVADTGIHHLGWSRQEAIDYLTDLGFNDSDAGAEVDRYIVWPGQAPSYMIGMLEILRLRDEAETTLGTDFDLAEFHTEILRHGSVPIAALDEVVANWIANR